MVTEPFEQFQLTSYSIRLTASFDYLQIYFYIFCLANNCFCYVSGNILGTNKDEIQIKIEAQLAQGRCNRNIRKLYYKEESRKSYKKFR